VEVGQDARWELGIEVKLDLMLVRRKVSLTDLSERVGISLRNLSLLKTGKVKGIRFGTLGAICRELDCQPGDLLEYLADDREAGGPIPPDPAAGRER
jgi:putative transcriptional regulator